MGQEGKRSCFGPMVLQLPPRQQSRVEEYVIVYMDIMVYMSRKRDLAEDNAREGHQDQGGFYIMGMGEVPQGESAE